MGTGVGDTLVEKRKSIRGSRFALEQQHFYNPQHPPKVRQSLRKHGFQAGCAIRNFN